MKKYSKLILLALLLINFFTNSLYSQKSNNQAKNIVKSQMQQVTAAEAVNKGAQAIVSAKGLRAVFSISSQGHTGNGTLVTKGNKFVIESPAVSCWYNGVNLYSYNPRNKETTIIKPTAKEIAELNPLSYVYAKKAYYAKDVAVKDDKRTVLLTPYDKGLGIKHIKMVLKTNDKYLPESIRITLENGMETVINIKSISLNTFPDAKTFEYPKSKYPGVEIIDLR